MLNNVLVFIIIAFVLAILGFGFLAGVAATIAKWLFALFVILVILSFFNGRGGGTTVTTRRTIL